MAGIPRQQPSARHAAGAARIDGDEVFARGDDVHLAHVDGILGMPAAAVQHEHDRRGLAARKIVNEISPLAAVVLQRLRR